MTAERLTRLEHDVANLSADVRKLRAEINPELQLQATEKTIHIAMILGKLLTDAVNSMNVSREALTRIYETRKRPDTDVEFD